MAYQEGPHTEGRRAFLQRGGKWGVVGAVATSPVLSALVACAPEVKRPIPDVLRSEAGLFLEQQISLVSDPEPRILAEALTDHNFAATSAGRFLNAAYSRYPTTRLLAVRQANLEGYTQIPKDDISFWEYFLKYNAAIDGPRSYKQYALVDKTLADDATVNLLVMPEDPNRVYGKVYSHAALMDAINDADGTERNRWYKIAQEMRHGDKGRSVALSTK